MLKFQLTRLKFLLKLSRTEPKRYQLSKQRREMSSRLNAFLISSLQRNEVRMRSRSKCRLAETYIKDLSISRDAIIGISALGSSNHTTDVTVVIVVIVLFF